MITWTGFESASDSVATWLVTYALHSTLWIAAALVAARFLSSARLRELLFKGAVLGGLVSAALHGQLARGGDLTLGWERASSTSTRPVIGLDVTHGPAVSMATPLESAGPTSLPAATAGTKAAQLSTRSIRRPAWTEAVVALWLAGAAWGLALVLRSWKRLRRLLAGAHALEGGPVLEQLRRIERDAGGRLAVRVSTSPLLSSPIAAGSRSSGEICVPERALTDLGEAERASLLAHELAHVSRRDPLWKLALLVLERVFFFQPLLRIAARRIEREAEFLCDEFALRWTSPAEGSGLALARCLGEIAAWRGQSTPRLASAMVARHSQLVQRVERALEGAPERPTRVQFAGLGVGLAACAGLLANNGPGIARPRHAQEPAERPTVEPAGVERLKALGYLGSDEDSGRAPGPGIQIVVSREGTIAITQVHPVEIAGAPEATVATSTRIALEDEQAFERLARVLKLMVADFDKQPLVEGDPTSPMVSAVTLRIEADELHAFRTVQKIMELCGRAEIGIWNIVLVVRPSEGSEQSYPTPLAIDPGPGPDEEQDPSAQRGPVEVSILKEHRWPERLTLTGAPRGRVEVLIEVVEPGRKLDVVTGEAWNGEGPYRFEDRAVAYRVTTGPPHRAVPPPGEVSPKTPEPIPSITVQVHDPRGLTLALDLAKKNDPNASVVIAAEQGVVYGDVVRVLDIVTPRFRAIKFAGAR